MIKKKIKKRSKNDSENEALKAAEVRIYISSSSFVVKNNFSREFEFCFESCLSENERHFQRET